MTRISRHPRRAGGPHGLIERDWEVSAIAQDLATTRSGAGSVVYVEGPAGIGKTALLDAAAELAADAAVTVLAACGAELERAFPFGVALQLLEPVWLAADPRDREALLLGPAAPAAELLTSSAPAAGEPDSGAGYRLIHALHWLVRNLVAAPASAGPAAPLVLIVDDLQWADAASARFLAYLAQRIAPLPVLMVVAATAGAPAPEPDALSALRRSPRTRLLTPSPLSAEGVAEAARRHHPQAEASLPAAVLEATGGHPALVDALLGAAVEQEITAADGPRFAELVPDAIVENMRRRLGALSPAHRAVAVGTALLDGDASLRAVAEFAEADPALLPGITDALAAAGLLRAEIPLVYTQPLLRRAVLATLAPTERQRAHAAAAAVLVAGGADPVRIAPHLIATAPGADEAPLALLRECAAAARAAGDRSLAIALLERAVREPAPRDVRAELMMELGLAEVQAGLATADARLAEAKRLTRDPRRHAQIALMEGERLYARGDYARAAEILESGMTQLNGSDPALKRQLTVAYVAAAAITPGLAARALAHRDGILPAPGEPVSPMERVALAHTVALDGLGGMPNADLRTRVRQAWGDGALLEAPLCCEHTLPALVTALLIADELDLCDEVIGGGRPDVAPRSRADGLRPLRAWSLYLRGRLTEAEAEARASAELDAVRWPAQQAAALAVVACCQIHRGSLTPAEAAVDELGELAAIYPPAAPVHHLARSELRLAQHRPDEALADATAAAVAVEALFPGVSPVAVGWRPAAASAHLALGQAGEAILLLEAALADARRLGNARVTVRALRLLGLALGDETGLACLAEAVEVGEATTGRLEYLRALIDHGAALRRANQRVAARPPLSYALHLSHHAGASVLADRARTELIAAGARPRRVALSGIDSLTASQRRVAELAARGLTTRQVAEALFVSPKTVEFHLRQTYRKLGVASREELARLFGA